MPTLAPEALASGIGARPEGAYALPPRISWGAVFAGGITAVAVGAMLNLLGLAIGATAVDPATPGGTPAASTLGLASGIWLIVADLIGLGVGGYVAARLSGTADGTDGILHGLSVWAIAFLISAVLLGNVVAGIARTTFGAASSIVGGAAQGAGQAVQAAASQLEVDPEALVERAQSALRGAGGDPARMTTEQRTAEIGQILTRAATDRGPLPQDQRDRLTQLAAAEYGVSPEEAQQRLRQAEQQLAEATRQAEATARRTADAAAAGTATAAYWLFGAMLLGAIAAVIGARMGTRRVVGAHAHA
jgi:hypothetical protein